MIAMLSVLLACGMGLGISLLVGLPWTTITAVIIFLAIGLGIDNTVVVTVLTYRGDRSYPLKRRIIHAGRSYYCNNIYYNK